MPKKSKKNGRPSVYSPELASDICKRLAIGESLVEICREDKMPSGSFGLSRFRKGAPAVSVAAASPCLPIRARVER